MKKAAILAVQIAICGEEKLQYRASVDVALLCLFLLNGRPELIIIPAVYLTGSAE